MPILRLPGIRNVGAASEQTFDVFGSDEIFLNGQFVGPVIQVCYA
jgi:hypothetical protein